MNWSGKAIGALAGSAFGPVGLVVGAWIGHSFDQESEALDIVKQQEYYSRLSVFACGVCAAYANGILHPNEKKRLNHLASEIFGNLGEAEVDSLIQTVQQNQFGINECAKAFASMHLEAQRAMALEIISILYADGSGDESENLWLRKFAELSGTNLDDWKNLMRFFEPQTGSTSNREACLRSLGLPSSADAVSIKTAYRNLVRQYHPDVLTNIPPAVRRLAEEKLQDLNFAYEALTKNLNPDDSRSQFAIQSTKTATQGAEHSRAGDITHCFICGQQNRLPAPKVMLKARCGVCYALLLLPKEMVVN
jgi:DnaJ like chaperone protein